MGEPNYIKIANASDCLGVKSYYAVRELGSKGFLDRIEESVDDVDKDSVKYTVSFDGEENSSNIGINKVSWVQLENKKNGKIGYLWYNNALINFFKKIYNKHK